MPDVRHHISSAVVTTRPEQARDLSRKLDSLEGVETHGMHGGKIVVVIEGPSAGFLGEKLVEISAMDDVIAAHMVFEQAIVEEMSDDDTTNAA